MDSEQTLKSPGTAEAAAPSSAEKPAIREVVLPTGPVPTIMDRKPAQQQAINAEVKVEDKVAAKVEDTPAAEKETVSKAEDTKPAEEKPKEEPAEDRFDKHPRFQELLTQAKEAKERAAKSEARESLLLEKLDDISQKLATKEPAAKIPTVIPASVRDELTKLWEDDPIKAMERSIQLGAEMGAEQATTRIDSELTHRSTTEKLTTALRSFKKDHTDFDELWDSGELHRMADESPLYNTPIAAYLAITHDKAIKVMDEKYKVALKELEDNIRKEEQAKSAEKIKKIEADYKAKRETTVIRETPVTSPGKGADAELKGGGRDTLLERHLRRQNATR